MGDSVDPLVATSPGRSSTAGRDVQSKRRSSCCTLSAASQAEDEVEERAEDGRLGEMWEGTLGEGPLGRLRAEERLEARAG